MWASSPPLSTTAHRGSSPALPTALPRHLILLTPPPLPPLLAGGDLAAGSSPHLPPLRVPASERQRRESREEEEDRERIGRVREIDPTVKKMDLKDSLSKFKQQQERCQSSLASIAASASKPKHRAQPVNAPSAPARPSQPIKFSNDTERLQHINSIRKSPVGAQIKLVIELLYKTRQAFTAEQINEATYVDIHGNKAVFDSLRNNPKVSYDGRRFSYKSKHDLKGKDQLLVLVRKFPEGLAVVEVKDAYPNVLEDLQALKAAGEVWLLSNMDSQEDIVYPNDPKAKIKVDDDLKQLFREIELPRDMVDIEKELQKNGIRPMTNTAKRRAAAQINGVKPKAKPKKKQREITKRTKLTNAHLPELFQNLNT
ncbi:hypothetical protein C2845_PM10G05880 [Panicum miliaceum]|uniref:TFIIE beta domain-containing protein n=1 Tax=Panicum miliaceum TaxID=4540 RepID=A0A3L6PDW5_PANMI|nr:hypothetical protein C2845_PM10G05880 [Panicum miliaceum]